MGAKNGSSYADSMRNPALIALYAISGAFFVAGIWFTVTAMRYYGGFTPDASMGWVCCASPEPCYTSDWQVS